jgi:hypothetical protein
MYMYAHMWWHMPKIPSLGELRQKNQFQAQSEPHSELKASLGYIARLCLKNNYIVIAIYL